MKIAIIGTGYVGLVSGVCFSEIGHTVTCVDNNPSKISSFKAGDVKIYEPGLKELMATNTEAGRLSFTVNVQRAVQDADAVFIGVGTPTKRGDGNADLTYVFTAAAEIAAFLAPDTVVVIKSTVPVGTNRKVFDLIKSVRPELAFTVASNPEFLREGAAIADFMSPDRIIVGVETDHARAVMEKIYAPLTKAGHPLVMTDLESSELIKYAANAFLATKVTFVNEMAALCERVGADIGDVTYGMGLDDRIGSRFLRAGPGYGGSCFPKDTRALARIGQEQSRPMQIVESVIKINEEIKYRMIDRIFEMLDDDLNGKTIAIFGVTFKPDTDDMRDAPALTIVPALVGRGANVRVVDPQGEAEGAALLPGVAWFDDAYGAAIDADLVVVLTEWDDFRRLDLSAIAGRMHTPKLADLRNIYSSEQAIQAGFNSYISIGRTSVSSDDASTVEFPAGVIAGAQKGRAQ